MYFLMKENYDLIRFLGKVYDFYTRGKDLGYLSYLWRLVSVIYI